MPILARAAQRSRSEDVGGHQILRRVAAREDRLHHIDVPLLCRDVERGAPVLALLVGLRAAVEQVLGDALVANARRHHQRRDRVAFGALEVARLAELPHGGLLIAGVDRLVDLKLRARRGRKVLVRLARLECAAQLRVAPRQRHVHRGHSVLVGQLRVRFLLDEPPAHLAVRGGRAVEGRVHQCGVRVLIGLHNRDARIEQRVDNLLATERRRLEQHQAGEVGRLRRRRLHVAQHVHLLAHDGARRHVGRRLEAHAYLLVLPSVRSDGGDGRGRLLHIILLALLRGGSVLLAAAMAAALAACLAARRAAGLAADLVLLCRRGSLCLGARLLLGRQHVARVPSAALLVEREDLCGRLEAVLVDELRLDQLGQRIDEMRHLAAKQLIRGEEHQDPRLVLARRPRRLVGRIADEHVVRHAQPILPIRREVGPREGALLCVLRPLHRVDDGHLAVVLHRPRRIATLEGEEQIILRGNVVLVLCELERGLALQLEVGAKGREPQVWWQRERLGTLAARGGGAIVALLR